MAKPHPRLSLALISLWNPTSPLPMMEKTVGLKVESSKLDKNPKHKNRGVSKPK
ncbi:hypothetical protein SESBI_18053 [Sesbania bispinosa]|nr:hypothetical protein SESBI_18053 [Sesbania bispinosa]